jgi:hypothetical protein
MKLYKLPMMRRHPLQELKRDALLICKCVIMMAIPLFPGAGAGWLWYTYLFRADIHLKREAENIITSAWIPTLGVMYALFAAVLLSTVWGEYKMLRAAIKKGDKDAFADFRDESVSPLVHTLMLMLSLFLIGGFSALHYPDAISGFICVGTMTYLLTLIMVVIIEIDDPCSGVWFIKDIPQDWLTMDVKQYRRERNHQINHAKTHEHQDLVRAGI